jgi:hypothetical protein
MRQIIGFLVLGLSTGFPVLALAKLLDPVGTAPAKVFQESGLKIAIATEVKPAAGGAPKLFLTGAGVRKKKVALFNVNVYVAAHYSDVAGKAEAGKVHALELTFLRDLSAEQVRGAFQESLKANGADPNTGALKTVLAKIDMPMPKGTSLTLLGIGGDKLQIETPTGTTLSGEGPALVTDFWKIWFGKPADSGLADLKPQLTGSL